jgi:hypothetical protein
MRASKEGFRFVYRMRVKLTRAPERAKGLVKLVNVKVETVKKQ